MTQHSEGNCSGRLEAARASLFNRVRGRLIVSCQSRPGEPLYGPVYMAEMAKAAQLGGACAVRANGAGDVAAVRDAVHLPIIGIEKRRVPGFPVYITPSAEDAAGLARAGSAMIALDGTPLSRPPDSEGRVWTVSEIVRFIHEEFFLPAMADISTFDEGLSAEDAGFDCVATTMSGYTPYSPILEGPDFDLITGLSARLSIPLIAEGRIISPDDARKALDLGAWSVVVGKAITMPHAIVERFVKAVEGGRRNG